MADTTRLSAGDEGGYTPSPPPLVSVFTATYDIGREIGTAYRSLVRQGYPHWEWVIVDDSPHPETAAYIEALADLPAAEGRIRVFRQCPLPQSVGATKAAAGALCRGEVMVELDHDDELMPNALELVAATFVSQPDIDFGYSDWVDWIDETNGAEGPGLFPPAWGFGLGAYATEMMGGHRVPVALSPPITWETIRHIVSTPNHLRARRSAFYRRIGGHDHRLPVADDYELVMRTFLYGTMAHIPRPLYIQHHSPDGTNTSRRRNAEILLQVEQTTDAYRVAIDRRCLTWGMTPAGSPPWSWVPIAAANARIDVVADAAADRCLPLVSIVVPTYSRPELLQRAIESALNQSYANVEVLVVGDHCPDVDEIIAGIDDPRVRHWNLAERADDLGTTPRNYALKVMARGTLVAYLDDDNWWEPDHLSSLVALLVHDPLASFAFSSFEVTGVTIECRRPRRFQIDILHRRFLPERYGYWRPSSETEWAHDWEFVSRWADEPWVASLQPTLHYTLDISHQRPATVEVMKAIADEERRAALAAAFAGRAG